MASPQPTRIDVPVLPADAWYRENRPVDVRLTLTVAPAGFVEKCEVDPSLPPTGAEIVNAAMMHWRFDPATVGDSPQRVEMVLAYGQGDLPDSMLPYAYEAEQPLVPIEPTLPIFTFFDGPGSATMPFFVTAKGETRGPRRSSLAEGYEELETSLREAVLGTTFRPATIDGQPVATNSSFTWEFDIPPPDVNPMPTLVVHPQFSTMEAKTVGMAIRVTVGTDGKVAKLDLVRSDDYVIAVNMMAALKQWEFEPVIENGVPVENTSVFELIVRLSGAVSSAPGTANPAILGWRGHSMENGRTIEVPNFPFPRSILMKGTTGLCRYTYIVETDGTVREVNVLESPDRTVAKTVELWQRAFRYEPIKVDGNPVRYQYNGRWLLKQSRADLYSELKLPKELRNLETGEFARFSIKVSKRGKVTEVTLLHHTNPQFAYAMLEQLRKARFYPLEVNGQWHEREGEIVVAVVDGKVMNIFPYSGDKDFVRMAIAEEIPLFRRSEAGDWN